MEHRFEMQKRGDREKIKDGGCRYTEEKRESNHTTAIARERDEVRRRMEDLDGEDRRGERSNVDERRKRVYYECDEDGELREVKGGSRGLVGERKREKTSGIKEGALSREG